MKKIFSILPFLLYFPFRGFQKIKAREEVGKYLEEAKKSLKAKK
jgi:hypothetical protein